MLPCQLLIDPPADGAWNMAVDEALLDRAATDGQAALRFYQWRRPTLSLGYFQPYADREKHAPSATAAVVRRLSGGGSLVHDHELTYSLCLPASHPLARQSTGVYEMVHRGLIAALESLGLDAQFHGRNCPPTDDYAEPFLCFARRTSYDIVMMPVSPSSTSDFPQPAFTPAKIAGSAQRRSGGALLQHGGVLLARSPQASELPGILDLASVQITPEALIEPWISGIVGPLGLVLSRPENSTSQPLESISHLVEKYAGPIWTKRR